MIYHPTFITQFPPSISLAGIDRSIHTLGEDLLRQFLSICDCELDIHFGTQSETGDVHLLLISRTPGLAGGAIGVVSLEDILEEILLEEIVDETDHHKQEAKRITHAAVMRRIGERRREVSVLSSVTTGDRTPADDAQDVSVTQSGSVDQ
ncbi:hypothetical protein FB451DRAFT_1567004 [Mycena latifolia]|nr:hypothetical protein FB451DRAFT_1567004 [Mycena latifolia]